MLHEVFVQEMDIIKLSLEELAKTWQTAKESLRVLQSLQEAVSAFPRASNPAPLQADDLLWQLFRPFGPSFSTGAQVISDNWEQNPTFLDNMASNRTMQIGSEQSNSAGASAFSLGLAAAPTLSTEGVDPLAEPAVDFSPQTMMDNVLQDILAQSHFSGEDWFFCDLQE